MDRGRVAYFLIDLNPVREFALDYRFIHLHPIHNRTNDD
jgi:hypothetical protein